MPLPTLHDFSRQLLVVLCALSLPILTACTENQEWTFALDECGRTCGAGPLFLFDQLEFIVEDEEGLDGFDLDGVLEDCETPDGTAPDGRGGIDNQFGAVWDVLPDTVATVLPNAIKTSLESGTMMVVMELVGSSNLTQEGAAALVLREGAGDLLVSSEGRPLGGQTVDLASGDNLLGYSDQAWISDHQLEAEDLSMIFRLRYLDTDVELAIVGGRATISEDDEGGVDMKLGGVVPVDSVMQIVAGLGGSGDANLAAALEALIPLLVDSRTRSDGACDGISGAFSGHAVPVHLFELGDQ